jgi:hypothetical protein
VGTAAVLRAPVPKTAVDENGHTRRAEHDVGLAPKAGQGCLVEAVTEPQGMKRAAKDKFWRCAFATLGTHAPSDCVARGERLAPTFRHPVGLSGRGEYAS